LVQISPEANESVLQLVENCLKAQALTNGTVQILAQIAEQSCCARHHSNKMWGSGLAQDLAFRWLDEIKVIPSVAIRKIDYAVKVETVSAVPRVKPVAFAKHVVGKGETLVSKLLEPIEPKATTIGSLYTYTHTKDAFLGMVKIGYTGSTIDSRLDEWADCGHGNPILLDSYGRVRHPKRVEHLTHFELLDYWHALRWCEAHGKAHIEWFKIDVETASTAIRRWSSWMDRANPYDRRGHLKGFWKETVEFLTMYEVPITAEVMVQVQELEEGSTELLDFIDDDALRRRRRPVVKREQSDRSQIVVCLSQCRKSRPAAEGCLEVKVQPVKVKVEELRSPSKMVSPADLVVTVQSRNRTA
jgi:hypothetical protein